MEIIELIKLKDHYEAEVLTVLKDFEDKIGLRVTGAEIYRAGEIIGVKIKVDL